jgi:hypothetical protein
MNRISEYINGPKKAFVDKESFIYSVSLYENSSVVANYKVTTLEEAENLAEDFVSGDKPLTLLNE